MTLTITYPFDSPGNYTFDTNKVEIAGGEAKLKLIDNPGQDFTETFDNDTGFTYDSDKAEFSSGQVRQKDQLPDTSTLTTFTIDEDAVYALGPTNNSLQGDALVSAGELDCTGAGGLTIPGGLNVRSFSNAGQAGCIRVGLKPNWPTGNPPAVQNLCEFTGSGNRDAIFMTVTTGGTISVDVRDSLGSAHFFTTSSISWVQGQEFILELNFDFDSTTRMYVDGTSRGTLNTSSFTRSNNLYMGTAFFNRGSSSNFNAYITFIQVFTDVQHTTNHTGDLPYTQPEAQYVASNVIMPEMVNTGPGTIISFDTFSTTEGNNPRYTIQIARSGNYLYWDGAAWSISDNTYAQANDKTTFNANVSTLPVVGEIYGQFKILFTTENSQSSVSELTASLTTQTYPVDNPTIEINTGFRLEELINFLETSIKSGSDEIKYILKKDTSWYYWNGSAWAVSDETYAQSNTAAEIITNAATFATTGVDYNTRIFLHSETGTTSPSIQQLVITYDFVGAVRDDLTICTVWVYMTNPDGTPCTHTITATLSVFNAKYKDNVYVCKTAITATPEASTGYAELDLLENVNMKDLTNGTDVVYLFSQATDSGGSRQLGTIDVPEQTSVLLWDIFT